MYKNLLCSWLSRKQTKFIVMQVTETSSSKLWNSLLMGRGVYITIHRKRIKYIWTLSSLFLNILETIWDHKLHWSLYQNCEIHTSLVSGSGPRECNYIKLSKYSTFEYITKQKNCWGCDNEHVCFQQSCVTHATWTRRSNHN